jgi:dTDP-L-rhamnose 4-epimerase
MKVLITGGAGFIGSNLTKRLVELGHSVTILDNLLEQIHGHRPSTDSALYLSVAPIARFIEGSVTSREAWKSALLGQDAVVHLAAETGTGQSMYEIDRYTSVNVGGTALLLDILANEPHSVTKLVVASSRSIYGEGKYESADLGPVYPGKRSVKRMQAGQFEPEYPGSSLPLTLVPTDEESKIHPTSVYGVSKQAQEQLITIVAPTLGIQAFALRYQNVYGPGQSLSNPYTGILSIFSTQIRNGLPINIFEDGNESRDFVYIDDVVDATARALETDSPSGEILNVGSGVATTVTEVVAALFAAFNREVPVSISGNYRLGDIRHNYADISKAARVLNFEPRVSFADGVRKFVEWVEGQPLARSRYDNSLLEMKTKDLFR